MFKINLKEKNAITLIALVITIIVLLILAGISLSLIMGEGGILTRATNARKANDIAGVKEKIELKAAEYSHDYLEKRYVKQELPSDSKAGDFVASKIKEYATANSTLDNCNITYTENTKTITITQNGYSETGTILEDGSITWETSTNQGGDSETIDNSDSLVLALVDDLGTRSTIYLYNNTDKITEGYITITMPDGTDTEIVAHPDTSEIIYDSEVNNYATYTVAKNGLYKFSATANGETTETKVKVENIEKFTAIETLAEQEGLSYAGGKENAYTYKGAAVPKGYYVDTKSEVNTGLVVTDEVDDEGYSLGNEWVWVPVNSTVGNDDYYYILENSENISSSIPVQYDKYSKLWSFSTDSSTNITTKESLPNIKPSEVKDRYRELGVFETTSYNYIKNRETDQYFSNVNDLAEQFLNDYENMILSIDAYNGFFIGRYETTGDRIKPGEVLTSTNWYSFYNQNLTYSSSSAISGMIYDTLWDATLQWLAKSGYWVGLSSENYCGYGNYSSESIEIDKEIKIVVKPIVMEYKKMPWGDWVDAYQGRKLQTGQVSYTMSNNIYDLAGNFLEFSQGAGGYGGNRLLRGGHAVDETAGRYGSFASQRSETSPSSAYSNISTRPCLYIK